MADVYETDYTTDPPTYSERSFTPEEIAQQKIDAKAAKDAQKMSEAATKAREDALNKLHELGLTIADLTALGIC